LNKSIYWWKQNSATLLSQA